LQRPKLLFGLVQVLNALVSSDYRELAGGRSRGASRVSNDTYANLSDLRKWSVVEWGKEVKKYAPFAHLLAQLLLGLHGKAAEEPAATGRAKQDPEKLALVMVAQGLNCCHQRAAAYQRLLSMWCYAHNIPVEMHNILHSLYLTQAYSTTAASAKDIAKNSPPASELVKQLGGFTVLVIDNYNQASVHGHRDHAQSNVGARAKNGTVAALVQIDPPTAQESTDAGFFEHRVPLDEVRLGHIMPVMTQDEPFLAAAQVKTIMSSLVRWGQAAVCEGLQLAQAPGMEGYVIPLEPAAANPHYRGMLVLAGSFAHALVRGAILSPCQRKGVFGIGFV
jgi:hypothetical protein